MGAECLGEIGVTIMYHEAYQDEVRLLGLKGSGSIIEVLATATGIGYILPILAGVTKKKNVRRRLAQSHLHLRR